MRKVSSTAINNKAKEKEDKKRQRILITVIFIIIAAVMITAVAALLNRDKIPSFSSTDSGDIVNNRTGKKYTVCKGNLSPRNIGEQYGEFEGIKLYRLYTVNGVGVSPDDYLVDEDGILFRGLEIKDIGFEEFGPIGAYFFYQGSATGGQLYPKKEYLPDSEKNRDGLPDDSELTKKITDIAVRGEPVAPTGAVDGNTMFELKFCSAEYAAFYYSLYCLKDENGSAYIYDASANLYYECPDELNVRLW